MINIASTQVKVFPVSTNRDSNSASRLFYEHNIANILRQVSDAKNGFIISGPSTFINDQSLTDNLELCIYGYYVKILAGTKIVIENASTNINIVAGLKLTAITVDDNDIIYQLNGQDDANGIDDGDSFQPLVINSFTDDQLSELKAVNFIETSENSNDITVYLPIFKYNSESQNYILCTDSLHKFESSSIKIVRIDGKR